MWQWGVPLMMFKGVRCQVSACKEEINLNIKGALKIAAWQSLSSTAELHATFVDMHCR